MSRDNQKLLKNSSQSIINGLMVEQRRRFNSNSTGALKDGDLFEPLLLAPGVSIMQQLVMRTFPGKDGDGAPGLGLGLGLGLGSTDA